MLRTLERANLFLVPLDDRREWYRYHHLFADVLRARLLSEQPDLVPLLHQRASQWYERHDLTEESVRHALAARDFDRAAHLIELAVPAIRRHRQEAMMHGWLKALPDDAVRRSPVLSVFYGSMLMVSGDLDAVEPRLDDAERALAAVPEGSALPWADTDDLHTLPATIAIYRASLAQARGDVAGTAEHARRALDLAGPDDHLARGGAAGFLGLAAWAHGRRVERAGDVHAGGGQPARRRQPGRRAERHGRARRPVARGRPAEQGTPALRAGAAAGRGPRRAGGARHRRAARGTERDRRRSRRPRERQATPRDRRGSRRPCGDDREPLSLVRGDGPGSPKPTATPRRPSTSWTRPSSSTVRASSRTCDPSRPSRPGSGSRRASCRRPPTGPSERGVSATDDASYLREFDHLTLVRLLLAQHRAQPGHRRHRPGSRACWTGCSPPPQTSGRAGSLLEIRMLQALAHDAQGHRPQALEGLARACGAGPRTRGVRPALPGRGRAHGGAAERRRAPGHRWRPPASPAPPRRIGRCWSPRLGAAPGPVVGESLSERELQVLRLLGQRAERAADRPRAVRLAQHGAHPHQAHLHQARRHQPPGGGPPRPRTRPDLTGPAAGSHPVSHIVG